MSTPSEVTAVGYTVPVFDYLTAHEMEQVEIMAAEKPDSATRHDLRVFAMFVESRTGERVNIDKAMLRPIKHDDLAVAVEALTGPFFDAQKARLQRRYERLMGGMTREDIQSQIDQLQAALEQRKSDSVGVN